jgi:hypothetical protein
MRTTLDLNDNLLAKAKSVAAQERTSLTRLIEEALVLRLRPPVAANKGKRRRLPVFRGRGGLTAAVRDPKSNRAMLEAADGSAGT